MAPQAIERATLAMAGAENQANPAGAVKALDAGPALEAKAALDALEQAIAHIAVGLQGLLAAAAANQERGVEGRPILNLARPWCG